METLFTICNGLVLPGWFLLLFFPRRRWGRQAILGVIVPCEAAVYGYLLATGWGAAGGGFGSLAEVSALFDSPRLLLAGWIHYLAFDLMVGLWETREAVERNVPALVRIPCLLLTLMFGPLGLALFLIARAPYRRAPEAP